MKVFPCHLFYQNLFRSIIKISFFIFTQRLYQKQIRFNNKGVNAYFLLDLQLPSPKFDDSSPCISKSTSRSPQKFGFLQLLEKIHGKDLTANNPWFNPSAKSRDRWRERYKKKVRFSTTEIVTSELPQCRYRQIKALKPGQLHAISCPNSTQETVEVLGEHVWQNRVFILESCKSHVKSHFITHYTEEDASRHKISGDGSEDEGYYQASVGSLEELGVSDSVELAKERLDTRKGVPVEIDGVDERASSSKLEQAAQEGDVPHPHMALELSSPITSDEEATTPASTIKYSDSCLSESPDDDAVFLNNLPGAINQNEDENGPTKSTATFMQNDFEMFETPKFRKRTSDYGSSESDIRLKEASTERSDDESEIDLSEFLDEIPLPNKSKPSPVNCIDLAKTENQYYEEMNEMKEAAEKSHGQNLGNKVENISDKSDGRLLFIHAQKEFSSGAVK